MSAGLKTSDHSDIDKMYVRRSTALSFPELSSVLLLVEVATLEGAVVPAGAEGTIVGVWRDGAAYEVEFLEPVSGLATVDAAALQAIATDEDQR